MAWVKQCQAQIDSTEVTPTAQTVEDMREQHALCKAEIETWKRSGQGLMATAQKLTDDGHSASTELGQQSSAIEAAFDTLEAAWSRRNKELAHCSEAFAYQGLGNQSLGKLQRIIASVDKRPLPTDITLGQAGGLVKNNEELHTQLVAQEDVMADLDQLAQKLMANVDELQSLHTAEDSASTSLLNCLGNPTDLLEELETKRFEAEQTLQDRSAQLEDAVKTLQLLREAEETDAWITEKMKTATDENYLETTNLKGKLKAHDAFVIEVMAQEPQIERLADQGRRMASRTNSNDNGDGDGDLAEQVAECTRIMADKWAALKAQCQDKGKKLSEANQQMELTRFVDDHDMWCQEMEKALQTTDCGKDLTSAQHLVKKHEVLAAEVASHKERMEKIELQSAELVKAGSFPRG